MYSGARDIRHSRGERPTRKFSRNKRKKERKRAFALRHKLLVFIFFKKKKT
jgi:hypothetical protein